MKEIIDYFVHEKNTTLAVARVLEKSLIKYEDIQMEFCRWLEKRNFDFEQPVIIEGYTAKEIQEREPSLDAAGVYNFLVTMREDPEKAKDYLENGFRRK